MDPVFSEIKQDSSTRLHLSKKKNTGSPSRVGMDVSCSPPPLASSGYCYEMETETNTEDELDVSDLDSNMQDNDSNASPPLSPDKGFWIPNWLDNAWPYSSSTCPPDTAGMETSSCLPVLNDLISTIGLKDTTQPLPQELNLPVNFAFSSDSSAPSTVGAGLTNLGNTCYLNSVLQCLTHSASLVKGLLSLNHPKPCEGMEGFCVLCAMLDHVNDSLSMAGKVISPNNIVNHLSYFSSNFEKNEQEDAHEFFLAFLDKLGRCFPNLPNKEESSSVEERNFVEEIFGGEVVGRISCGNCGHLSESYEAFIDLSLGIGDVNTLSSALESYTKVEHVEYACANCKEAAQQKRIMLHRTPSIAVIQLKRFQNTDRVLEKLDSYVEFPIELDLHPYTTTDNPNHENLQYDLYAVIVHVGASLHGGHYFCFVRSSPDVWHRLDDSQVTRELGSTVLSQEAYMMFYAKRGTPWMSTVFESRLKMKEDQSFPDLSSTISIPLLLKFSDSLIRELLNVTANIVSSPSKKESHDKDE